MKLTKTTAHILIAALAAAATLGLVATAAMAHTDPVPPPYAGLKNPFPWDDAGAQAQGQKLYQKSCSGCHGAAGNSVAAANFASAEFSARLRSAPEHAFFVLSEGLLSKGMPPYKSSLSEEERWQALTYMSTLSQPAGAATPPAAAKDGAAKPAGTMTLAVSEQTSSDHTLVLTASLRDANGKPQANQTVSFLLKKAFFATGLMEIGEAETDKEGKAVLSYSPREDGDIQVLARQGGLEASSSWVVQQKSTYQAEAGIRLPTLGPELNVGGTTLSVASGGSLYSPTGGVRLPGGSLSWLLLFVAVILVVWATYFRVLRQVWSIAGVHHRGEGLGARLIPLAAMAFVLIVGVSLAFIVLHGPYTHLNLLR